MENKDKMTCTIEHDLQNDDYFLCFANPDERQPVYLTHQNLTDLEAELKRVNAELSA